MTLGTSDSSADSALAKCFLPVSRFGWMATAVDKTYPGNEACAAEILDLANEYLKAAIRLKDCGRKRQPTSWSPFRLCAIHAVELYLNAWLLHQGHSPEAI